MLYSDSPPFPLGSTLYEADATLIAGDGRANLKGAERFFMDNDEDGTGIIATRSNRVRKFRIVKNDYATVTPKQVIKLDTYSQEIFGLAAEGPSGFAFGVVDEHLPAAGCILGDYCWVCIEGLTAVVTDALGTIAILDGDYVVMGTDGKVREQDVAELDADLYAELNSRIGRSVHGSTVSTNNADVIVDIKHGG